MASPNVKEFTDSNFESEVLTSPVPVLVDFFTQWCPPCKALAPTIDAIADEYTGRVKVGKIDAEANTSAAMRFGISGVPTVIIFKGGKPVGKLVGARPKGEFVSALAPLL